MEKEVDSKIFLIAVIAIVIIVLISSNINLTGAAIRGKLGRNNFCSYEKRFICSAGQGDCDKDTDCQTGLKCAQDVGDKYGFSKIIDVCEGTSVSSSKPNKNNVQITPTQGASGGVRETVTIDEVMKEMSKKITEDSIKFVAYKLPPNAANDVVYREIDMSPVNGGATTVANVGTTWICYEVYIREGDTFVRKNVYTATKEVGAGLPAQLGTSWASEIKTGGGGSQCVYVEQHYITGRPEFFILEKNDLIEGRRSNNLALTMPVENKIQGGNYLKPSIIDVNNIENIYLHQEAWTDSSWYGMDRAGITIKVFSSKYFKLNTK